TTDSNRRSLRIVGWVKPNSGEMVVWGGVRTPQPTQIGDRSGYGEMVALGSVPPPNLLKIGSKNPRFFS
ncbi:MAG: hypothetical protein P5681_18480, partial [Limnospira sp. PMC 894.15]|uniref:hypothetical protein n=1 Tax=Limnospira sp. PMC 894.15 TaxID=2981100 RepID=UPI0028E10D72